MVTRRSLISLVAIAASAACAAAPTRAGVIRHDRPDAQYTALADGFASVGILTSSGGQIRGSGVLISPEWVLTASHFSLGTNRQFTAAGQSRGVAQIERHPDWENPNIHEGFDLTLLKLDAPIFFVEPAILPEAMPAVVGQPAIFTGYGETGDGNSGSAKGTDGSLRAGMNTIDRSGGTFSGVRYADNIVWADFDKPASAGADTGLGAFNRMGSKDPLPLEYLVATNDSGAGVFVESDGRPVLVGVNSLVLLNNVDGDNGRFEYGDQMATTLIGPRLDWIRDTALPSRLPGDANNDLRVSGEDLLAVQENFGASGPADGLLLGDANDDGLVTGVDLVAIQEDFGVAFMGINAEAGPTAPVVGFAASGAGGLVPEPAAGALLGLTFLVAGRRKSR